MANTLTMFLFYFWIKTKFYILFVPQTHFPFSMKNTHSQKSYEISESRYRFILWNCILQIICWSNNTLVCRAALMDPYLVNNSWNMLQLQQLNDLNIHVTPSFKNKIHEEHKAVMISYRLVPISQLKSKNKCTNICRYIVDGWYFLCTVFRKILNSSLNSNRCEENYKILWISIIEQNMRNLPYSEVFAIFVFGYLINVTITAYTMDPNHFVRGGQCSWVTNMFVGM